MGGMVRGALSKGGDIMLGTISGVQGGEFFF